MRVVFVLRSAEAYPVFTDLFFPFVSLSGGRSWFLLEPRSPPFFLVNFFFVGPGNCVCLCMGGVRGLVSSSSRLRSCLCQHAPCVWCLVRLAACAVVFVSTWAVCVLSGSRRRGLDCSSGWVRTFPGWLRGKTLSKYGISTNRGGSVWSAAFFGQAIRGSSLFARFLQVFL
jgi:hypothetical protein